VGFPRPTRPHAAERGGVGGAGQASICGGNGLHMLRHRPRLFVAPHGSGRARSRGVAGRCDRGCSAACGRRRRYRAAARSPARHSTPIPAPSAARRGVGDQGGRHRVPGAMGHERCRATMTNASYFGGKPPVPRASTKDRSIDRIAVDPPVDRKATYAVSFESPKGLEFGKRYPPGRSPS